MKNLQKNISRSLVFLLLFFSINLGAVEKFTIVDNTGTSFGVKNGKTWLLKPGENIDKGADLITEEGSKLHIRDSFFRNYYLSGGSQLRLVDIEVIELLRGAVGFKVSNEIDVQLKTANSITTIKHGSGILSFDVADGKSQILTTNGQLKFSNIIEIDLAHDVTEGEFSFVQKDYESGMPRTPTPIGKESYEKVLSMFNGYELNSPVPEVKKIATVDVREGKFIVVKSNQQTKSRAPASVEKTSESKLPTTGVPLKIYKHKKVDSSVMRPTSNRAPAAIVDQVVKKVEVVPTFEESLKKEYQNQTRHPKEVNQLINELKNYKADFKTNY